MKQLEYLKERISDMYDIPIDKISHKNVSSLLCGENADLAKNPFSQEFLENVVYNSDKSFALVLYLQLTYLPLYLDSFENTAYFTSREAPQRWFVPTGTASINGRLVQFWVSPDL